MQQKSRVRKNRSQQNETGRQFGPATIGAAMDKPAAKKLFRCAIYTRKSTEHNLDLEFNSLHAQREACEAYIKSQAHEGWRLVHHRFDDGAFSGASLERPALQELLTEVRAGKVDVIVFYKVDRLTRSLSDFAKLVELFDQPVAKLFRLARSVVAYGSASAPSRIFSETASTLVRSSIGVQFILANTKPFSIVRCLMPCRPNLRPVRTSDS
jgi:hypothetical protein